MRFSKAGSKQGACPPQRPPTRSPPITRASSDSDTRRGGSDKLPCNFTTGDSRANALLGGLLEFVRCLPRPVRVGVPVRHRRFAPRKHSHRRHKGNPCSSPASTFGRLHTISSRHRGSIRTARGGAAGQPCHRLPPPRPRPPSKPRQSTTRWSRSGRHLVERPACVQLGHARPRSSALW